MLLKSLKCAAVLATILAAVIRFNPTEACSICVSLGDPFQVPHPHAVRIAVATRASIDSGRLPVAELRPFETLDAALIRVAYHQCPTVAAKNAVPVRIDVLIVDEPALYRLELREGLARVRPLSNRHHWAADARLVTTSSVAHALDRLDLAIVEAEQHGLLEIEGERPLVVGARIADGELTD